MGREVILLRPHRTLTVVFLSVVLLAAGCGGSDVSEPPQPVVRRATARKTAASVWWGRCKMTSRPEIRLVYEKMYG